MCAVAPGSQGQAAPRRSHPWGGAAPRGWLALSWGAPTCCCEHSMRHSQWWKATQLPFPAGQHFPNTQSPRVLLWSCGCSGFLTLLHPQDWRVQLPERSQEPAQPARGQPLGCLPVKGWCLLRPDLSGPWNNREIPVPASLPEDALPCSEGLGQPAGAHPGSQPLGHSIF